MNRYQRLNIEEREEISRMLVSGSSMRAIARMLNRSPSTISREIWRTDVKGKWRYRAIRAEKRALRNARKRRLSKHKLSKYPELFEIIKPKLRLHWSPEQIASWLKTEYSNPEMHLATETIYTYLYVLPRGSLKKELISCL